MNHGIDMMFVCVAITVVTAALLYLLSPCILPPSK